MTNTYAHIFDSTLKRALDDYRMKKVDIIGAIVESWGDPIPDDALLLKRTVLAQALPNGHCHLPVRAGPCPHANACLAFGNDSCILGPFPTAWPARDLVSIAGRPSL